MNPIKIHDIASATFLIPFSTLCVTEVVSGYTIYPLFLTHAFLFHMTYDLLWIILQPSIIPKIRSIIILNHLVCILAISRPLIHTHESRMTAYACLVEIDTSFLMLKRLFPDYDVFKFMYYMSNIGIRVYYETFFTIVVWNYYAYQGVWYIIFCQLFINILSCGICALTWSRKNPALIQ